MKKTGKIILELTLLALSEISFVLLACACLEQNYFWYGYGDKAEIFCYGLCALGGLGAFSMLSRKLRSLWGKGALALGVSALFTAVVALYNPFLQFLDWNFGWYAVKYGEILPYIGFLQKDWTYTDGWGEYRYPLCFAAMLALCAAVAVFQMESVRAAAAKFREWLAFWLLPRENVTETLLGLYAEERISSVALEEYCRTMGDSVREKLELKQCLKEYSSPTLWDVFFEKFGPSLSEKERARLEKRRFEQEKDFLEQEPCS